MLGEESSQTAKRLSKKGKKFNDEKLERPPESPLVDVRSGYGRGGKRELVSPPPPHTHFCFLYGILSPLKMLIESFLHFLSHLLFCFRELSRHWLRNIKNAAAVIRAGCLVLSKRKERSALSNCILKQWKLQLHTQLFYY